VPGWKIIYQVTLICASTGQDVNSSKCQRSEGKTKEGDICHTLTMTLHDFICVHILYDV
jgi:hypothetical protein